MHKVLIANRGEIACRIIRSCQSMGYSTVAIYSEADQTARHVKEADESYLIGPPPVQESYLKSDDIIKIAIKSNAQLIHPGYGLLAENARFAEAVNATGLSWVGPAPSTISAMGDKGKARVIAISSGVPVLPGSPPLFPENTKSLEQAAKDIGYPLLIKATGGGGGIGMRLVSEPSKLVDAARSVSALAERTFDNGAIFLERHIADARHIEVQIFGLGDGRVFHLGDRECSIQRRFQKIIEEAPAPNIPTHLRESMTIAACKLAANQSYAGAGTIEFILDKNDNKFYFLEMNTRIQVEHPTTEMISKQDIVQLQLELATGQDLGKFITEQPEFYGHSIECRLYAEKPEKNFIPSPGTLNDFTLSKASETVRVETGYVEGDTITPFYDPMIAKIVTFGNTRDKAIQEMQRALSECQVNGVSTNIQLLKNIISEESFKAADTNTNYIDTNKSKLLG